MFMASIYKDALNDEGGDVGLTEVVDTISISISISIKYLLRDVKN